MRSHAVVDSTSTSLRMCFEALFDTVPVFRIPDIDAPTVCWERTYHPPAVETEADRLCELVLIPVGRLDCVTRVE